MVALERRSVNAITRATKSGRSSTVWLESSAFFTSGHARLAVMVTKKVGLPDRAIALQSGHSVCWPMLCWPNGTCKPGQECRVCEAWDLVC